jgi:hypothetical protein
MNTNQSSISNNSIQSAHYANNFTYQYLTNLPIIINLYLATHQIRRPITKILTIFNSIQINSTHLKKIRY